MHWKHYFLNFFHRDGPQAISAVGGQNFARYLCIKSNQGDTAALHKILQAKGGPSQESAFNVSHGDLGHAVFWAKDSRTVEFCELNKFGAL